MSEKKCKYLSDDFREICVNDDCPVCADFCPVANYPEICKFAEFEGQKRTQGDKVRAMSDDELAEMIAEKTCEDCTKCPAYNLCKRQYWSCYDPTIKCSDVIAEWLQEEVQNA